MRRSLFFILLIPSIIFLASGGAEQNIESDVVPGRVILQLSDASKQEKSLADLESNYAFASLKALKCLSGHMGIWYISYEPASVSDRILLHSLKRERSISNVQFEHYISLREVIPDDPEFENQWALRNTGQSGGLPGADIDACLAWEIGTNDGASALGDTIVMAIVDDGFAMGHDDMFYWKNRNEIKNNGIDDDLNGYIDDYDGWNAYYSSGYIAPKDHGQHVAGIAGARGNNGLGVSGVNWNGRVMTVAGSSTIESTVVEAYSYIHKMRWLYDQTNGSKGAFVVVANSSFGVDYGDPEDFPIWGAMIDSMGSLGIISVAATTNAPLDVDIVGDVPTTFTSECLIGVTNTTNKDEKNYGAGWGAVSIDLGAPGKGIMSTRIPNTYGYKTGTSMAAPQVTGSLGLMFSVADEAFMLRYDEDPEPMAIFMKNLLLDAVDTLAGFDTLVLTGGRLNLNNAIQKLVNPRIELPFDTLLVSLIPDSTSSDTILIKNLLGFELPYEAAISGNPGWLSHSDPSGLLAGHGEEELTFFFNAEGLSFGFYTSEMIFTDFAGMSDTLFIVLEVSDPSNLLDPQLERPGLHCFPNPFSSSLNIRVERNITDVQLTIYNMKGEIIKENNIEGSSSREVLLNWNEPEGLPAGIYIVNIRGKGVDMSRRVVKINH